MSTNLVSIIIPVFNLQDYLDKCLNSLINQIYSNIEIIIVDDGSTDSSLSIIDNFLQKDSRIKLLRGSHSGTAAARKMGIQSALGEYLTFVDGDDWLDEDSIETMVQAISSSDCDMVVAKHRWVFLEEPIRYEYKDDYPFDTLDPVSFMDFINERKDFTLWAKIFKKELFKDIIFHVGVPIGQDGLVLKQLVLNASKIKAENKIVYNYLYRQGSAMRKSSKLINKLLFLEGNLNNLKFYNGPLYNKERDRLLTFWLNLGIYYLKMSRVEKGIYNRIWYDNIIPYNLHKEYKDNPKNIKKFLFIINYPKMNSLLQMIPIYIGLFINRFKK